MSTGKYSKQRNACHDLSRHSGTEYEHHSASLVVGRTNQRLNQIVLKESESFVPCKTFSITQTNEGNSISICFVV